jgi:hypothetical protein
MTLRAQTRRRSNADAYELAVLNLLSQCDPVRDNMCFVVCLMYTDHVHAQTYAHDFIISSAQDFVWFKLAMIDANDNASDPVRVSVLVVCMACGCTNRTPSAQSKLTLLSLQRNLLEYGAEHFNQGGQVRVIADHYVCVCDVIARAQTPLLFCQLLLLTQQFERAVSYLRIMPNYQVRACALCDAVITLAAHRSRQCISQSLCISTACCANQQCRRRARRSSTARRTHCLSRLSCRRLVLAVRCVCVAVSVCC